MLFVILDSIGVDSTLFKVSWSPIHTSGSILNPAFCWEGKNCWDHCVDESNYSSYLINITYWRRKGRGKTACQYQIRPVSRLLLFGLCHLRGGSLQTQALFPGLPVKANSFLLTVNRYICCFFFFLHLILHFKYLPIYIATKSL